MTDADKLRQLARLVRDMRRAQANYFRARTDDALSTARTYERRVDRYVAEVLDFTTPALPFDLPREAPA